MFGSSSSSLAERDASPSDWRSKQHRAVELCGELRGELRIDGKTLPVRIGDLPGSGAVVYIDQPPPAANDVELWIENFGCVPVELIHSGRRFCGLVVSNPAVHRDRLLLWLRHTLKPKSSSPQHDRSTTLFLCARAGKEPRQERRSAR